jgi:integrase
MTRLVIELERFWARMREKADIRDVRIHDLRRTFAFRGAPRSR